MEIKLVKLSDIANIYLSSIDKKSNDNEASVCLCNFTDVYNNWAITKNMLPSLMKATASSKEIQQFILKKGMVAITKDSETRDDIGMSTYIADDFENTVLGYHCALIVPKYGILDGRFLNGFLNTPTALRHFENNASGSGQRYTLTNESIGCLKIPCFDMKEQIKIGNFLSNLDKKIEVNKLIIQQQKEYLRMLYNYWFIQYDFTENKDSVYYNDDLKKEVPNGWSAVRIKDICDLYGGFAFSSDKYSDDSIYKLITIKNVQDDGVNVLDAKGYGFIPEKLPDYCMLKPKDILLSLTGHVGRVGLMYTDKCLLNQRVALVNPKKEQLRGYIYSLFKSDELKEKMIKIATGTSQKNLSPIDLGEILIPYNENIALNYSLKVENSINQICDLLKENDEIIKFRKFILPLLYNKQAKIG